MIKKVTTKVWNALYDATLKKKMFKDQENECGHFNTQIKKQITDPLKFPTNLLKSPMLPRKQKTYVVGQQNNISLAKVNLPI